MGLLDQYAKFRDYIAANTPRSTRPVAKPGDVLREGLLSPNKFNAPAANRFKDSVFGLLGGIPGAGAPVGFTQGADYFNRGEPVAGAVSVASGVLPFIPPTAAGLFTLAKVADRIGAPLPTGPARKQAGAIVYHGSPHKFDKFDMSKIGTGEGAQAYGHGLYFAESPEVASAYKKNLSKDTFVSPNGSVINRAKLADFGFDRGDIDVMLGAIQRHNGDFTAAADAMASHRPTAAKFLKGIGQQGSINEGSLYKVDIPDEAIPRMLDWDKPLSEQPEGVRVAVQDLGLPANATGKDAYNALANLARDGAIARGNNAATTLGGSQSAASVDLQGYGIPGIRYLDGSSRGAGQGTSNFVLFDDQLPRILEINGQPTGLLSYADEAARKPKPKKAK